MEKQEGGEEEDKEEEEKGQRSRRKVKRRTRRNGAGVKKEDLLQENRGSAEGCWNRLCLKHWPSFEQSGLFCSESPIASVCYNLEMNGRASLPR